MNGMMEARDSERPHGSEHVLHKDNDGLTTGYKYLREEKVADREGFFNLPDKAKTGPSAWKLKLDLRSPGRSPLACAV